MRLTGVNYPIAFIVGTAARGRSGFGVVLYADEEDLESYNNMKRSWGQSRSVPSVLCATASGVLEALWMAKNKFNLSHISLSIEHPHFPDYLRRKEYPKEPGAEELFRQIYASPMKFTVIDYKGCYGIFMFPRRLARRVCGTNSIAFDPINDNLYKNGVIEVAISAFIKRTADGVDLGAYGWYFEKDMRNDWGIRMNDAGAFREPESELDVHVEALYVVFFLNYMLSRYEEVRIKTASRHICSLIRDFKKTGLESYKSMKGIEKLKGTLEDYIKIEVEYTPNEWEDNIRQAYQLALDEFNLRENSMYWKNGIPKVYTDGACSRNGKKGAVAGYGVFWGPSDLRNASFPITGLQTNNRAEYLAVIHALESKIDEKHFRLIICVDTQLLIDSIESYMPKWKRKGWKTKKGRPVKNRDLLEKIDELMSKMESVEFEKVLAHSGHEGNEGADRLAREAVEKAKRSK